MSSLWDGVAATSRGYPQLRRPGPGLRCLFGLLRLGVTCHACYQARGALTPPFHPYPGLKKGGLFLCPFRRLTAPRRYLGSLPSGLGLSSAPTRRMRDHQPTATRRKTRFLKGRQASPRSASDELRKRPSQAVLRQRLPRLAGGLSGVSQKRSPLEDQRLTPTVGARSDGETRRAWHELRPRARYSASRSRSDLRCGTRAAGRTEARSNPSVNQCRQLRQPERE